MALCTISTSKHAAIHCADTHGDELCEYTLRKVLSWLEPCELASRAALVSRSWAAASSCKEVWRRRMHQQLLEGLFSPQEQQQQQQPSPLAAAAAALSAAHISPTRLFTQVYGASLLANGAFLERLNAGKGAGRPRVWEPTYHRQGMTWAHPCDFSPELCPLPLAQGFSGSGGDGQHPKPFSVGCLATTSGAWSEVTQVLDLQAVLTARGVPAPTAAWLLSEGGLTLEFSAHVAGGARAGGEYQVVVILVTEADAAAAANNGLALSALPRMTLPFGHPPPSSPGVAAVGAANLAQLGLRGGSNTLARAPLHPAPSVWSRYSCQAVLPRGAAASPLSHVVVALRGRASRLMRPGNYATKFADAQLRFLPADQC